MNIWAGVILGLTALGIIGYKVTKLSKASENISIDVKGRLHSLDFSKVVFAIDAIIKNPSDVKIYILQPFVSIYYKENEIATSNVSDYIIPIDPFAPAPLKTILLSASYMNLSDLALEFVKKLQSKETKVTVQVKILVNVVLGMDGDIPEKLKDYKGSKQIIAKTIKKDMTF